MVAREDMIPEALIWDPDLIVIIILTKRTVSREPYPAVIIITPKKHHKTT